MRIQHNILAMNAYRNYNTNTSALAKNLEKLSSGYKINRAGDDAAGLAISEKMRAQITGLNAAQKNVKDGISLVKTAEGAMQEIQDMLNRMDYLATQSANGTYDDPVDRLNLQKEVDALKTEINRIADSANFNGIKLLDGSLGEKVTDTMTIPSQAIDMTDGITINSPLDGAATKASMEIKFGKDNLFSAGDGLTFKVKDADGNEQTISTTGNISGNDFDAQMTDLAAKVNAALTGASIDEYEAVATADGIKIEAKDVDVPQTSLVANSAAITRSSAVATANITTPGANATHTNGTTADHQGYTKVFGGNTAAVKDLDTGNKLTFNFKVNGKDRTITLEAGKDFDIGKTNDVTTTNIVTALNAAKFDADDTTGVKEEILGFSDYFTATANVQTTDGTTAEIGSIHIKAATAAGSPPHTEQTDVGKLTITYNDDSTVDVAAETTGIQAWNKGTGGADAVAQVTTVSMNNKNMAVGDKFVLEGELSDGRTFKVELEAIANGGTPTGNQFALGNDVGGTFDAIIARLGTGDVKVKVTNPDNSVEDVDANKLFGATMEFTAAKAGSGNTATMTITSNTAGAPGKGVASKISRAYTDNVAAPEITDKGTVTAGKAPSASENSLTFSTDEDGKLLVEQGTTLTIDGKTYEFVDGSDPTRFNTREETNVAVAVDGLNAGTATVDDLAAALKTALGDTYTSSDNKDYDVTAEGGTVTIKSQAEDGTGTALEITMGASKPTTTLSINGGEKEVLGVKEETDVSSVKAGDTVTINGKVYEFTAGKRTKNEDAVRVDISGIDTASGVAEKLAEAVNGADNKIIARADGKDVIFTSKYNHEAVKAEDAYAAPKVELPKSSNSLTLQIGDTADRWNQMSVKIGDMHTNAMGTGKTTLNNEEIDVPYTIADINISTQEGAQKAIAAIKNAINYVSGVRGDLGAVQNRLDHTANNLSVMVENIQDAESTIRDTDIAEEMMAYTKNNILIQSAQAMLAQANAVPQGVLQLLG